MSIVLAFLVGALSGALVVAVCAIHRRLCPSTYLFTHCSHRTSLSEVDNQEA